MTYKINTEIEKDGHGYFAYAPELKGCHSQGDTLEKALENMKEAIELYVESLSDEDKENYYQIFDRIEYSKLLTPEIVHIKLDMPFPFYGRDYIVRYTQLQEERDFVYRFNAVKDSGIPVHEDYVRLIHAAGEWRLHPIDESSTEVTYIWNGELLGDFPDWALTRAWKTQGDEVLNWLKEAAENQ